MLRRLRLGRRRRALPHGNWHNWRPQRLEKCVHLRFRHTRGRKIKLYRSTRPKQSCLISEFSKSPAGVVAPSQQCQTGKKRRANGKFGSEGAARMKIPLQCSESVFFVALSLPCFSSSGIALSPPSFLACAARVCHCEVDRFDGYLQVDRIDGYLQREGTRSCKAVAYVIIVARRQRFGRRCSISRKLSRYYHDTCEKCSFVALLDMDGVFFVFWSGTHVCLILQNHWWLNQIAISPKSFFFGEFSALCFRQ
jgi:hypothetical protein